jgi:hypothetical protein
VYQAPPPPPVAARPPASSEPTAAQVLAAQRAAARAKSQRQAERLKKQRRAARRKRVAAKLAAVRRAEVARKGKAARRDARMVRVWDTAPEDKAAVPFVGAAAIVALIILGLALVPAEVVPWYRVSIALEDHREHLTLAAGVGLTGAAVFFAVTFLNY